MKPIIQFTIIMLIGASIVAGAAGVVNLLKEPPFVEKIVEKPVAVKPPECPLVFDAFQSLQSSGQYLPILQQQPSHAAQGQFVGSRTITVKRSGSGVLACGYLYLRARIDGKPLDEQYDSIFIDPQGFGGHLLHSKTINIPQPHANTSEAILPLNAISYLPTIPYDPQAQNYRIADWVKLLNVSNALNFHIGLSTQNENGVIEEIGVAYKCWNPDTGNETSDCQLSK